MKITANNVLVAIECAPDGKRTLSIGNHLFNLSMPVEQGLDSIFNNSIIDANGAVNLVGSPSFELTDAELESFNQGDHLCLGELTVSHDDQGNIDVFNSKPIGYCGILHINT